jgi:membrane fusion protein (multidrug efflux system)
LSNLYIIESGLNETDKILLDGLQTAKEDEKVEAEFVPAKEVISNLQLIK